MRGGRAAFIATISLFFAAMSVIQIPALLWYGLMTPNSLLLGVAALIPILAAMHIGSWLARHWSAQRFDVTILMLLSLLAIRLIWGALA